MNDQTINKIQELERTIEYEQMQYDIACEHPTDTAQFLNAQEKQRLKLVDLKAKLLNLKNLKNEQAEDSLPVDSYEVRKHFEATLSELATLYDCDAKGFREHLKAYLRGKGIIQRSTTELPVDTMQLLATQIGKFVYVMREHTPPAERGVLDFDLIFKQSK